MADEAMSRSELRAELVEAHRRLADLERSNRSIESLMRTLVEETTVTEGDDFLRALVRNFAGALGVRFALVSECLGTPPTHARSLAYWADDGFIDNVEYDLAGTPCERVMVGETCFYRNRLREKFPDDSDLVAMDVVSYLGIPICSSTGAVVGHYAFLDDKPMTGAERFIAVISVFAGRTAAELERRRAEDELRKNQQRLRALASRVLLVEEQERLRVAVELHDGALQTLTSIHFRLDVLGARLDSSQHLPMVKEVSRLIEQVIRETRSLTFELYPPVLHDLGLLAALGWLAERTAERYGLRCVVQDDMGTGSMARSVELFLFQAVRELWRNARNHGEAKEVHTRVEAKNGMMRITVADDGTGFDLDHPPIRDADRGFGLFSIRERLKHLGGRFTVESSPGHGTRITMFVPAAG